MEIIITTSAPPDFDIRARAEVWSAMLKAPIISREAEQSRSDSIAAMAEKYNAEIVVIVGRKQTILWSQGREYYYHPNMAKLRILALSRGQNDQLVLAAGLKPGSSFLDCTLGLASDAIIASHVTGTEGLVVGLESQAPIAALTSEGLNNYADHNEALVNAMRRIKVHQADAYSYLSVQPSASFDVVYFDPMFSYTKKKSSGIEILRLLGKTEQITFQHIQEALRVAKQRVVVKANHNSKLFGELGITRIVGGKYSSVAYGVIEK